MPGERKRTVKLFCPTLSKLVQFVAWDEHRLDLGSIARTFGLDPLTLKLNGHFIGRGADLVASSVTWKSLLCFFSSRGLPAGSSDADAISVDGKISKTGTKRARDPADVENGSCYAIEPPSSSIHTGEKVEDGNFLVNKKPKESISGHTDWDNKVIKCDGFGLKRKQCLEEDVGPSKRIRMTGTNSGSQAEENGPSGPVSNTHF
ncbi:Ribosomal RNA small subunit methyltransferase [Actinidia chinensis var. chinensis]|uniref:Ribosomal RNA small subunit methyltransferase n=1 Tax=Actinidia chinensis var. chinensis TaxID=1590841 RepID=A0A2R6QSI9_ACTCC|nr:Ribosomal RNA small subunit methyltransferase [Actinidia chinensis var. chinensis]